MFALLIREKLTQILINALDLLEEERTLSFPESTLRRLAIQGLQSLQSEKLAFWHQHFNSKMAVEWDGNTRFFHASASARRRKNAIPCLTHNGLSFCSHDAKGDILYDFYKGLLGTSSPTTWDFALHDLYPRDAISGQPLSEPFSPDEITNALFSMDRHASPGPDGFGSSFYKAFWTKMKPYVLKLFEDFYAGVLDLDGLNRAHLILLPKSDGVTEASGYRPISLQNCPMKLFSKVLANRVKCKIPDLIDADQTGFVPGRSIAENFIYAADLLSCCHRRKKPTVALKLDFKKAFDSVEWDSLDRIMAARGFDLSWRRWIQSILTTGKTAVMLNGVPGRWITCKRGLRQGDPISPYLFIIVADVLQRLVQKASSEGYLHHPIDDSLTCPVIQYADDTLLLIQGDIAAIQALKSILDSFSRATGLTINFHKSTLVPMHIAEPERMAGILGCKLDSFPQTYLGIPLSPTKLPVSAYQPLICSFDRYLAGWKARLLSSGGRLTLVNAVLSGLPIYFMSSHLIPKSVIEALDSRRRAFLWTGDDSCHGSRCLIAWPTVCQGKEFGGLGVKNFEQQNHCLLLKIVHKLHEHQSWPWKTWFLSQHPQGLGNHGADSFIARLVLEELPRYRRLTRVLVGNGEMTSFWHDCWMFNTPLAQTFPALYSHSTKPNILVSTAVRTTLGSQLQPRLSRCAREEKLILLDCLLQVSLSDTPDSRVLNHSSSRSFHTKDMYQALRDGGQMDPDALRIWESNLPTKIKFFGWLLHHERLNCRSFLYRRNIRSMDESYCERCQGILETPEHLFSECPCASSVWRLLGISMRPGMYMQPWLLGKELLLPASVHLDVILLVLWHIWKARNALIFDQKNSTAREVLYRIVDDLDSWSCRYKKHKHELRSWRDYFFSLL